MTHKDGCTAACPHFMERRTYLCGYSIRCEKGWSSFESWGDRDAYYRFYCCGHWQGCPVLIIKKRKSRSESHE